MDGKIKEIADRLFAKAAGKPFVFDCAVRFKGEDGGNSMTFCGCDDDQYRKIAASRMDNHIFFYVMSPEEFAETLSDGSDFTVTDIYENTYEILHL
jgi:hypothetical protein